MIKKLKSRLNKRKVKIFLLFLLCSWLAWFISNLSESYTNRVTFDMEYINVPDSLLLTHVSKEKIDAKIRASGFQFLRFNFHAKKVKINLSSMKKIGPTYFVPQDVYKKQIEKQLSGSMTLLEMDKDTLFFDFYEVYSKEVPVKSRVKINLAQNYLLDGEILVEPKIVVVTGPKNEIDTLMAVQTNEMVLTDVASDFSRKLSLYKPPALENTNFSKSLVRVSGKVSRFSEKIIDIPVEVINLPEGFEIKTFPNMVSVLCKAKIEQLKDLSMSDFELIADYDLIKDNSAATLSLELRKKPENIHSVRLLETQVEYILKRK